MKKYLLTIFGKFTSETSNEIALSLTPLVDSTHLKYQSSENFLIFHFASEVLHEEIHEYIKGSFFDIVQFFILSENNDNMSVFMPSDMEKHLFDLENKTDGVVIDIDLTKNQEKLDKLYSEDDEDDFVALLLDKVKKSVKKPTLDQILDKISSSGFDSLTQFEKDTLESYSKN